MNSSSSSSYDLHDSIVWNHAKPLILANSAIQSDTIINKIAQTIYTDLEHYSINTVLCHLMGPYGDNLNYNINLGIYSCSDDGQPLDLIKLSTISANDLSIGNWQSFQFNIDGEMPENKFLSFVMWQDGGDENNYVMWSYCEKTGNNLNKSWFTNDGINWFSKGGIERSLRITIGHEIFDLENKQVVTLPAESAIAIQNLNEGTPILKNCNLRNNDISINYPPLLISFICDKSGSMGWNDKKNHRKNIIQQIINKLQNNYPNDVLFDFIDFGGISLKYKISENLRKHSTINIDVNNPSRTTYSFNLSSGFTAFKNDKYIHNGNTYIVIYDCDNSNVLICKGEKDPLLSGLLEKTDGSGLQSSQFLSYSKGKFTDPMIAYGIKCESNHYTPYLIGEIILNNNVISEVNENNWELYSNNQSYIEDESVFQINNNGPNGNDIMNIFSFNKFIARKNFHNRKIIKQKIPQILNKGVNNVEVNDSSVFNVGKFINIIDGDNISANHRINDINYSDNVLTISPALKCDISLAGIIELIEQSAIKLFNGTTLKLLIKHATYDLPLIFYMQNQFGMEIEWDINIYQDWIYNIFAYINEHNILSIDFFDENENSLEINAKIHLDVDSTNVNKYKNHNEFETYLMQDYDGIGKEIYVESCDGYGLYDNIIVINNKNEIDYGSIEYIDYDLKYLRLEMALSYNFKVEDGSRVIKNNKSNKKLFEKDLVSLQIPLIDVTQENFDPDNYLDTIHQDIKFGKVNISSIEGKGMVNFPTITEDYLMTIENRKKIVNNLEYISNPSFIQNNISNNQEKFNENKDYIIESPCYIKNGSATSSIRTKTNEFSRKYFNGVNIPGVNNDIKLPYKSYKIYPYVKIDEEKFTAIQYINDFQINFISPINIHSNFEKISKVLFYVEDTEIQNGEKIYKGNKNIEAYGVYAGDSGFSIKYIITNKENLIQNGNLKISIYFNQIINQIKFIENQENISSFQNQNFINLKSDLNSKVSNWRKYVESNKNIQTVRQNNIDYKNYDIYENPHGWNKYNGLEKHQFNIPIVNGKAELNIPKINEEGILLIEASMDINGSQYEFIDSSLIMVRNPIMIYAIDPYIVFRAFPIDKIQIKYQISWMDGKYGEIEDGTILDFGENFLINPNISILENGISKNIFLIKNTIENINNNPENFIQKINLKVIHSSGIENVFESNIYWSNNSSFGGIDIEPSSNIFLRMLSDTHGWADGLLPAYVSTNLEDGFNKTPQWLGEDIAETLYELNAKVLTNNNNVVPNSQQFGKLYNGNNLLFSYNSINQNIGNHPTVTGDSLIEKYIYPWDHRVNFRTVFINERRQNITIMALQKLKTSEDEKYDIPVFEFKEPLSISLYIENKYIENNKQYIEVIANVKWKNKAIIDNLIEFGRVNNNEALVYFKAGIGTNKNLNNDSQYIDYRGDLNCYLDVDIHNEIKLSNNIDTLELILSKYTYEDYSHMHEFDINESGNGETTSIINLGYENVPNHIHLINNFIVDEFNGHSHEFETIAKTILEYPLNLNKEVTVIGIAEFDPTNCSQYTGIRDGVGQDYPINGNRMMFSSLSLFNDSLIDNIPDYITDFLASPKLSIKLYTNDNQFGVSVPTYFTGQNVDDIIKKFDIVAEAYFTHYYIFQDDEWIKIPQRPIINNEKILITVEVYNPWNSNDNTIVTGYNLKRPYITLLVKAKVFSEEQYAETSKQIVIESLLQWLPHSNSIYSRPTKDNLYIEEYLNDFKNIGSSPLYDAINMATKKMISYQNEDNEIKNYNQNIIVLSDMGENSSFNSLNNIIENIKKINIKASSQIICINVGNLDFMDKFISNILWDNANGFELFAKNNNYNLIEDYLFSNNKWNGKYGFYENEITLNNKYILKQLLIENVTIHNDSDIKYKFAIEKDKNIWGDWTQWNKYDQSYILPENLSSQSEKIKYKIRLESDSNFISPILHDNIKINYLKAQESIIVLKEINLINNFNINNSFVSSLYISNHIENNENSIIEYRVRQNKNDKFYYKIESGKNNILLTRYNEKLITKNNKIYYAINGGWPDDASIEIYDNNGIIIPKQEYSFKSDDGVILFNNAQSYTSLIMCVNLEKKLNISCYIMNFGSTPAILHNISLMYNITKRIPYDNRGNIINQPINLRLK
jgi:hypothetical protein